MKIQIHVGFHSWNPESVENLEASLAKLRQVCFRRYNEGAIVSLTVLHEDGRFSCARYCGEVRYVPGFGSVIKITDNQTGKCWFENKEGKEVR